MGETETCIKIPNSNHRGDRFIGDENIYEMLTYANASYATERS